MTTKYATKNNNHKLVINSPKLICDEATAMYELPLLEEPEEVTSKQHKDQVEQPPSAFF